MYDNLYNQKRQTNWYRDLYGEEFDKTGGPPPVPAGRMLLEDGAFMLLEDGGRMLQEA